jgi:hypothetical protein
MQGFSVKAHVLVIFVAKEGMEGLDGVVHVQV